jgi:hypothetical protein
MPVVLTASMEDQVQGPLMPELKEILPEAFARRVKRPGIVNAMHHRSVSAQSYLKFLTQIVAGYGQQC